ncbi:hypothetical protein L9F63_004310, partial [Diploptera punctata]
IIILGSSSIAGYLLAFGPQNIESQQKYRTSGFFVKQVHRTKGLLLLEVFTITLARGPHKYE